MSVPSRKIRVLVVDDSLMVRKMITDALVKDPQIEVVGAAPDPYVARDMIGELSPDVLTLDIEMPRMDGLTFLKILQKHHPIPVVIVSSISQEGSAAALEALALGAVEVLAKPNSSYSIGNLGDQLARCVKAAAVSRVRPARGASTAGAPVPSISPAAHSVGVTGASVVSRAPALAANWNPRQVILLGSSTGGVEALTEVLTHLPGGLPGICITQHIPPHFSRLFAERLNPLCAFEVREAAEGDLVTPGLALIAPGDFHLTLKWNGTGYRVSLNQRPPVHYCRPAVDVMFRSVAEISGARVVAALLTGMGSDGAMGMKLLREIGARTIAQNEETCVVYGMPRAAVELGVVERVLPLRGIAQGIVDLVQAQAEGGSAGALRSGSHGVL